MNVLITGVASGIGQAAADQFLSRGHVVYGIDRLAVAEKEGLFTFTADITNETSLQQVAQQLQKQGTHLDAMINIAGKHSMASLVESNFAQMKQIIDINLCGTMLVNRVFHTLLTEKGRIVIVTSEVAAFDPMPFNGLYNVSKTALDCYAQALRQELNLLGQKVVTIRPGAVETPLSAGSVKATADLAERTLLYKRQAKNFSALAAKFMGKPMKAEALAALIYRATMVKQPKLIYQKHRNPGLVVLSWLPKRIQCYLIKWILNMRPHRVDNMHQSC